MLIGFVFISCISHPMLYFITVKMKNQVPGTPSFSLFGTEWVELLEKKPGTGRVGYCDPVRAWSWGEVAWFSNLIWLKQSMPGTVVPLAMFSYSLMEKSTFLTASKTGNTKQRQQEPSSEIHAITAHAAPIMITQKSSTYSQTQVSGAWLLLLFALLLLLLLEGIE